MPAMTPTIVARKIPVSMLIAAPPQNGTVSSQVSFSVVSSSSASSK